MAVKRMGGEVSPSVSANVKRQAFEDLMRLSGMFRGIMLLADDMGDVASLDEAKTALTNEVDELSKTKAALNNSISGLNAAVELSSRQSEFDRNAAAGELADARRLASDVAGKAKQASERLIADAQAEAEKSKQKSATDYDGLIADAQRKAEIIISQTHARLADVRAEIIAKQSEVAAVALQVSERQEALANIKKQIQALLGAS